jgi:pseudaminic acid cytidylyltransferase
MNLCVIPARGGSKRIPRKNVRPFGGRPIIEWSIDAALASGVFDLVWVSTDDPEIAAIARAAGAGVPFTRPPHLADDHAGTRAVVRHAVLHAQAIAETPQVTCCLYPTAPFVTAADLRSATGLLQREPDAMLVMTVTPFPSPIWRALEIDRGRIARVFPEHAGARSQDLPVAYFDAGQYYVGRSAVWIDTNGPFVGGALPVILPPERAHDINTLDDWDAAERDFAVLRAADIASARRPS